jgi:hypothetical protein
MPPGGKVEMNIWTASQQDVDALTEAFEKAGFKNVSVGLRVGGKVVPGTTLGTGTIRRPSDRDHRIVRQLSTDSSWAFGLHPAVANGRPVRQQGF